MQTAEATTQSDSQPNTILSQSAVEPNTAPSENSAPETKPQPEATIRSVLNNTEPSAEEIATQKLALDKDWLKYLPEDLRDEPSLKLFSDLGTMAKSYVHAQRAVGAQKVPLPGKFATDEDWRNFFQKAGLPKELKDYGIENPNKEPSEHDAKFFDQFKEQAFKAGILPKQASELLKWYQGYSGQVQTDMVASLRAGQTKALTELKREWGEGYDKELFKAQKALEKFGGKEIMEALDKSELGNDVRFIKMFNNIANLLSEDVLKGEDVPSGKTNREIIDEINKITGDFSGPYHNKTHPNNQRTIEYVNKLWEKVAAAEEAEYRL